LPDDTGQYGVYGTDPGTGYPTHTPDTDYAPDTAYTYASAPQTFGYGTDPGPADHGHDTYADHDQQQYTYDTGQQPYSGYPAGPPFAHDGSGEYPHAASAAPGMDGVAAAGGQAYDMPQPGEHDSYGDSYGQQYGYPPSAPPPGAEWPAAYPDAHGYGTPTPADGVWVSQQRDTDGTYDGEPPPAQQYPYQGQADGYQGQADGYQAGGYEPGYDQQQYRY
jgi:hypothetical protein